MPFFLLRLSCMYLKVGIKEPLTTIQYSPWGFSLAIIGFVYDALYIQHTWIKHDLWIILCKAILGNVESKIEISLQIGQENS